MRIVSDIYATEMADCHRELLTRLQTRAKVMLPLFCGDELWGLLNVAESTRPRDWQPDEIEVLRNLTTQSRLPSNRLPSTSNCRLSCKNATTSKPSCAR